MHQKCSNIDKDDCFITETIRPQVVGAYAALPAEHTRWVTIVACSVNFFLIKMLNSLSPLGLSDNQKQIRQSKLDINRSI
jgi:hypothetical protein